MRIDILRYVLCAWLAFSAPAAWAEERAELFGDLIHSDVPLFGDGERNKWPRAFSEGPGGELTFGCESRVAFGDWAYKDVDGDRDPSWLRIRNYGVFHCAALVARAADKEALEHADSPPSFFVLLDTVSRAGARIELWVLQIGTVPGSDYFLLSRPASPDRITTFSVLQRQCPRGGWRGASIDIWRTGYCAINTRSELAQLARRMARLAPLGSLTLVTSDVEQDQKPHVACTSAGHSLSHISPLNLADLRWLDPSQCIAARQNSCAFPHQRGVPPAANVAHQCRAGLRRASAASRR